MTEYNEFGHCKSPGERFADAAAGYAALAGVYLEIYPQADYANGGVMFSAVSLPLEVEAILINVYNRQLEIPEPFSPNQPLRINVPTDRLTQAAVEAMPTYRTGFRTAREALAATMAAYSEIGFNSCNNPRVADCYALGLVSLLN